MGAAAHVSRVFQPVLTFFSIFLIQSLTLLPRISLEWGRTGLKKKMSAPNLKAAFPDAPLPRGANVTGFRGEQYISVDVGPHQFIVTELLADLTGIDSNEEYFRWVHKTGQQAQVDAHLVPKALEFARGNGLFTAAINVYMAHDEQRSALQLVDRISSYLGRHNLDHSNIVLEICEDDPTGESIDIEAIMLAKSRGVMIALDDFDPRKQARRLELLAPHCHFVKLDKSVVTAFEQGGFSSLPSIISNISGNYDVRFVAEGVQPSFGETHPGLIHATQKRGICLGM